MKITDEMLLAAARKYGLIPDTLKARVFALLDQGMSRREIRYVLRDFRDPENPAAFTGTVRKYETLWRQAQRNRQQE